MLPPVVSKFVAGETRERALEYGTRLQSDGIRPLYNTLGEHYTEVNPVEETVEEYCELARLIHNSTVDGAISVKPSQLGLDINSQLFEDNVAEVVETASECGVFVWLDMEDSSTTDHTLNVYEGLVEEYAGGVGVCLQANLKRTPDDIERLSEYDSRVRMVKGAYSEPVAVAHQSQSAVDAAYRECIELLFETHPGPITIGTHDDEMIAFAQSLSEETGKPLEVQMLMGVRESRQRDLTGEYTVTQYVPYGSGWLPYFYRRLREKKSNLTFALRAVLGS